MCLQDQHASLLGQGLAGATKHTEIGLIGAEAVPALQALGQFQLGRHGQGRRRHHPKDGTVGKRIDGGNQTCETAERHELSDR